MKQKNKGKRKILVLLDTHAILHRAYHALPDFSTSKGEPTGALYGLAAMVMKIVKDIRPDFIAACYDLPGPTFRHAVYGDYKVGRPKAEDDLIHQIKRSRDVCEALGIPRYESPGFEADDILGTIVEQLKGEKNLRIIIASGDMDTLQLVDDDRVLVYTLKKGLNDTVLYNEHAVVGRFGFPPKLIPDYKGLAGDPSDNIVGIAGIGEKTATALVKTFGTVESIYRTLKRDEQALVGAGIKPRAAELVRAGEEEALFSKTLATIRRDAPIVFAIPEKPWQESFSAESAEKLFTALEFRKLRERLWELVGGVKTGGGQAHEVGEPPPPEAAREAQIALWLLNSELTNPTEEDIYAFTGTRTIAEAQTMLEAELDKKGLSRVYREIELPLIPIIERAEKRGILVDLPYLKRLSQEFHKKLSAIESRIYENAGEVFNINSPKQLSAILFDKLGLVTKGLKKTAAGARSTRESELLKLKGVHPVIEKILLYRELQKLLSTYVDNIPAMAGEDGRLHTNLNQTGTTTGRMSSRSPNLQNIPSGDGYGKEIRKAFVAPPGFMLLACDYSQIEMRVLAALSKDPRLSAVFASGEDVHASVASFVFKVPKERVTGEMRRRAKVINFGIIYGMGVNALRENLGGTRQEAQEFYDNYFRTFPTIAAYFERLLGDARRKGYTETFFGRRRYVPALSSTISYIRAAAERMAQNAPLQGTAADLIKIAMRKADEELARAGLSQDAHLILQVHDELMYEVRKETLLAVQKTVVKAMEEAADLGIPLAVNAAAGANWGEMRMVAIGRGEGKGQKKPPEGGLAGAYPMR